MESIIITNLGGIAQVVAALAVLCTALFSGIAAVMLAKVKQQTVETHKVVNSRMDEFKKLFEERFVAMGELKESRKAAADATAGAVPNATLVQAEEKAKALIAEATIAAARLISEAHTLAATTKEGPVHVTLDSGPGVTVPLKVTTDQRKPTG